MQAVPPPIRVGMVGANPDYGWGSAVHRHVIDLLPEFTLSAVCTTRQESAERAAREFGAQHWFTDSAALVHHPHVDLVAICVKAPFHYAIAREALLAGKHVYCEWPLAFTTDQAEELANLARERGVKAMIGLHLRGAAALRQARAMIADGAIGEVHNVSLQARLFGPVMGAMATRAGGTTLMSIYGGHLLDALDHMVGPIGGITARSAIHLPPYDETGAPIQRDAADHIVFQGELTGGALFDVNLLGSVMTDLGCCWRIDGSEGTLRLATRDPTLPAVEALTLSLARPGKDFTPLPIEHRFECAAIPPIPDRYPAYPGSDASREALCAIGTLYRELAGAIRDDLPVAPDFARAVEIQNLLDRLDGPVQPTKGTAR